MKTNEKPLTISFDDNIEVAPKKNKFLVGTNENLVKIKMFKTRRFVLMYKSSWEELLPALQVPRIYYSKSTGYPLVFLKNNKTSSLHRMVMADTVQGTNLEIDHINGNKLDCRLSNLRACSHSENLCNKKQIKGKRYKGIYETLSGKYMAMVWIDGKNRYLGSYDTMKEAAQIYNEAAKDVFGQYAHLNKIGGK